ncbi:MAG: twin-arginine translocase TatA/TatE family subunit [Thermodesulfobacteriota bacterium]
MFGLGWPEILIIFFILFLLFGVKKLPEIGEGLGKTIRELRRLRESGKEERKGGQEEEDLISNLKKEVAEIPGLKEAKEIKETVKQVKKVTKFLR